MPATENRSAEISVSNEESRAEETPIQAVLFRPQTVQQFVLNALNSPSLCIVVKQDFS
jgi:hypothetical protein